MAMMARQITDLSPQIQSSLVRIVSDYLRQNITVGQARAAFRSYAKSTEPIDKLREIVEMSDVPIPFSGEIEEDSANASNSRRKMRTWTTYEDNRLLAGIYRFGVDNWAQISKFVGNGRTRSQCGQRWSRGLNPRICKDTWDHNEDMKLIQLVRQFGDKSWTKISQAMGNRSDVQCRYHYLQLTKDMPQLLQMPGEHGTHPGAPPFPGPYPGRPRMSMPTINFSGVMYEDLRPFPTMVPEAPPPPPVPPAPMMMQPPIQPPVASRRASHFQIPLASVQVSPFGPPPVVAEEAAPVPHPQEAFPSMMPRSEFPRMVLPKPPRAGMPNQISIEFLLNR